MPSPPGVQSSSPAAYVVTDLAAKESVSGLTWQRTFTEKKTWAEGQSYCNDLVLDGFVDWRLPSRIELISLIDFTRMPTIDHQAFLDVPNEYFWSASPTATREFYFSVYFGAGLTTFAVPTGASAHVRCVRGGGPGLIPRYAVTDATVVDRNTQLTWQRSAFEQPLPWESAIDHCAGLEHGWRLPSMKELQTIVDETRQRPAADPAVFPSPELASYWTATPVNRSGLMDAIYVDMRDGTTNEAVVTQAFWVRCVR